MLRRSGSNRGCWGEPYFIERQARALYAILELDFSFDTVLEIGCGKGLYAKILHGLKPNCSYVGCDLDASTLKAAFRTKNTDYVLCDARMLPIKDSCVDLVICSEVLEHLDSPYEVLSRLTASSGKGFLITFPVEQLGQKIGITHPEHVQNIQLGKIKDALESKKFGILTAREIARFFVPCGILEFLHVPRSAIAMSLLKAIDTILCRTVPTIFVPNRVILVIAAKKPESHKGTEKEEPIARHFAGRSIHNNGLDRSLKLGVLRQV